MAIQSEKLHFALKILHGDASLYNVITFFDLSTKKISNLKNIKQVCSEEHFSNIIASMFLSNFLNINPVARRKNERAVSSFSAIIVFFVIFFIISEHSYSLHDDRSDEDY